MFPRAPCEVGFPEYQSSCTAWGHIPPDSKRVSALTLHLLIVRLRTSST